MVLAGATTWIVAVKATLSKYVEGLSEDVKLSVVPALVTVNVCAFDVPPPPEFTIVTGYDPADAKSPAVIEAVNCVELTNVVVLSTPLNCAVECPLTKSEPFTVIVNGDSPTTLVVGLILDVDGTGVFPSEFDVLEAVHVEKSFKPGAVIVLAVVFTVPPLFVHEDPLSVDLYASNDDSV